MKALLQQLLRGTPLTFEQAESAFTEIMAGTADPIQTASLLTLMAARGGGGGTGGGELTVEELHGAATVLRRHVVAIDAPENVIDTCGTGGVGSTLFNISTTAAIVAAAAGAFVAKHGNRSITSCSGSADVLRALGVNIDTSPGQAARCLREAHICFAFAPRHHPAMKHVAAIRQALGFSTVFNLLGPLTNPAGSRRQVVGTRPELADKLLDVLIRLGAQRTLVVAGSDPTLGTLCDISVTGPTRVASFDVADGGGGAGGVGGGEPRRYTLHPEDLGLPRHGSSAELQIRSVEDAAARMRDILGGHRSGRGAARDIVLANAAAALWVAGIVDSLPAGVPLAAEAIDSGAARQTLERFIALSHA
ncbi:MAG TPA: anthranilate phosphoribosyltransferase [Phycisphaerae bacterium]|nr:anthranilate phosphoribosyltransferase [Phycisphaerae bacterium]